MSNSAHKKELAAADYSLEICSDAFVGQDDQQPLLCVHEAFDDRCRIIRFISDAYRVPGANRSKKPTKNDAGNPQSLLDLMTPEGQLDYLCQWQSLETNRLVSRHRFNAQLKDVDEPLICDQFLQRNASGDIEAIYSVFYANVDAASRLPETSIQKLLNLNGLGVWMWQPENDIFSYDGTWAELLGFHAGELPSNIESWWQWVDPEQLNSGKEELSALVTAQQTSTTFTQRLQHRGGYWRTMEFTVGISKQDDSGRVTELAGTMRDISDQWQLQAIIADKERQLRQSQENFSRLSQTDTLTGLFKRETFDERLHQEWARWKRNGTSFALLLIDIDYFTAFNQSYGEEAGDECLVNVAEELAKVATRTNDFIARYHGAQIAILLPDTHLEGAVLIADQARLRVEERAISHGKSLVSSVVTLSAGIATSALLTGNDGARQMLGLAEEALYYAKANGHNRTQFSR